MQKYIYIKYGLLLHIITHYKNFTGFEILNFMVTLKNLLENYCRKLMYSDAYVKILYIIRQLILN